MEKQKTTESGSDNFLITQTEKLLIEIIVTNCVRYVHRLFSKILWSRNTYIRGKHYFSRKTDIEPTWPVREIKEDAYKAQGGVNLFLN